MKKNSRNETKVTDPQRAKVFLLDDDPVFCRIMEKIARRHQIPLSHCSSLEDLGSSPDHREFDVAVLDYYLENLTGTDLALLFQNKPVILISQTDGLTDQDHRWPDCIREFLPKSAGAEAILIAAVCLAEAA